MGKVGQLKKKKKRKLESVMFQRGGGTWQPRCYEHHRFGTFNIPCHFLLTWHSESPVPVTKLFRFHINSTPFESASNYAPLLQMCPLCKHGGRLWVFGMISSLCGRIPGLWFPLMRLWTTFVLSALKGIRSCLTRTSFVWKCCYRRS